MENYRGLYSTLPATRKSFEEQLRSLNYYDVPV